LDDTNRSSSPIVMLPFRIPNAIHREPAPRWPSTMACAFRSIHKS
jgi:hypothetical protein